MKTVDLPSDLVDVAWLQKHYKADNLVILDASIIPVGKTAATIKKAYIPGSQSFDFEHQICDLQSPLPHMLPSAEVFEKEVRKLGIGDQSVVVVYDDKGIYASPRAWWMFKVMGFSQVAVLDGGLPAWLNSGLPTVSDLKIADKEGRFFARFQKQLVLDADDVQKALSNPPQAVVDARSSGRFKGTETEPRKGLRSGHMPGAFSLPFSEVLLHGHYKKCSDLKGLFQSVVGDREELIFSCGSGVTAAILFLAATIAGYKKLALYDGSWSEWGLPSERPVITGNA